MHNIHYGRDRQGVMRRVDRVLGLKRANIWLSHNRGAVAALEEADAVEFRSLRPWRRGQHAGNHSTTDHQRKRHTNANPHQPPNVFQIAILDSHLRPPLLLPSVLALD